MLKHLLPPLILLTLLVPPARADDTDALREAIKSLEQRVEDLEKAQPPPSDKSLFGLVASPLSGLKLGAYGELNFGVRQNPAANGQYQAGFDASRIVLLPTYQFTDSIIFNAEIEFEHAGIGVDNDDKLAGTAEIEQAYVDFKISPFFNIRAPGIDLVPIGYTN